MIMLAQNMHLSEYDINSLPAMVLFRTKWRLNFRFSRRRMVSCSNLALKDLKLAYLLDEEVSCLSLSKSFNKCLFIDWLILTLKAIIKCSQNNASNKMLTFNIIKIVLLSKKFEWIKWLFLSRLNFALKLILFSVIFQVDIIFQVYRSFFTLHQNTALARAF